MPADSEYLGRVLPALDLAAERFAALVTSVPDPAARIPGSAWTLRDAAAHVATVVPRYADGPEGRGTWVAHPRELPTVNQDQIGALGALDMEALAAKVRRDLAQLAAQVGAYGERPPSFRFHGGELVPADTALGILLGELVVHGWDIAMTAGRPWPIEPGDVELIVQGVEPILPGWVDHDRARGLTATYELRLRGQGSHRWSFRDGRLQVGAGGRPDVRISADPAALLLVLYKRRAQWPQVARGRLLAWGRRPWLAFSLAGRFHRP